MAKHGSLLWISWVYLSSMVPYHSLHLGKVCELEQLDSVAGAQHAALPAAENHMGEVVCWSSSMGCGRCDTTPVR